MNLFRRGKVDNVDGEFKDDFYLNLLRTIAWTEKIISQLSDAYPINYSRVLRTTNPLYGDKPFYKFELTWFKYPQTPDIPFNYTAVLASALRERSETSLPAKSIHDLGRILRFEIDVTTHDGAPCSQSDGFVDESDIPPLDTWFFVTKKYLYCWIPVKFIQSMQDAIDVEILGSYSWLDEINPDLHKIIFEKVGANENGQFSL